ncbi:hypothetical protein D9M69_610630 [compost metagenome]
MALFVIPTRSRSARACSWACALLFFSTRIGANMQFSSAVRCGNRWKPWNTMPVSLRTVSTPLPSTPISVPFTISWPSWYASRPLMQRIRVDLPLPEGPQTTMRSPLRTSRSMPFSTAKSAYHFLSPRMITTGWSVEGLLTGVIVMTSACSSAPMVRSSISFCTWLLLIGKA